MAPYDVQFTDQSDIGGQPFAAYSWDFGDGSTSAEQHPLHTYTRAGLYTVSLTVATAGGRKIETKIDFIDVLPFVPPPDADFSASPISGAPPLTVEFMNLTNLNGAESVTYLWDFGDGQTSTETDPRYTYWVEGAFTVSLTVTTRGGVDTETKVDLIASSPVRSILTFEENFPNSDPIFLSVFISADVATSGRVSIPGLGFLQTFSVVPGTATEVWIPVGAMAVGSDVTTANGIEIIANDPINVHGLNREDFTTDGFAAFPIGALGTEHFVMSVSDNFSESQFAIVANSENTTVKITPTASTGIRTAGVTYTVVLDRLEVYQLQGPDLTGTHIDSDKPIAVFGGVICANVPVDVAACDHVVEQMPSISAWGTDIITVQFATRSGGDTFRILAAQDGTTVTIQGASPETILLDSGQFAERILDGIHRIGADLPILVAQFANGQLFDDIPGDPLMMIVMPAERFLSTYTFATPSFISNSQDIDINYVNIVAPSSDAASGLILLDGVAVDSSDFDVVSGTIFSAAQVPVTPGSHTVAGPNPIGLYIYGFAQAESYGYPEGWHSRFMRRAH